MGLGIRGFQNYPQLLLHFSDNPFSHMPSQTPWAFLVQYPSLSTHSSERHHGLLPSPGGRDSEALASIGDAVTLGETFWTFSLAASLLLALDHQGSWG